VVRGEPEFGKQMDAAPASDWKHRAETEGGRVSPLEALGCDPPRHQAEPGRQVPSTRKVVGLADGRDQRGGI
jgi:hypothetical protein